MQVSAFPLPFLTRSGTDNALCTGAPSFMNTVWARRKNEASCAPTGSPVPRLFFGRACTIQHETDSTTTNTNAFTAQLLVVNVKQRERAQLDEPRRRPAPFE